MPLGAARAQIMRAATRFTFQQKLCRDLLGSAGSIGRTYLDPKYQAYRSAQVFAGRHDGKASYCRHTGRDMIAGIHDDVKCLVPGTVHARIGQSSSVESDKATVVLGDDGRYWIYGHMVPDPDAPAVNRRVAAGAVLGGIADPKGAYSNPHIHLSCYIVAVPNSDADFTKYAGWGRTYDPASPEAAEKWAIKYSTDSLVAYARWVSGAARATSAAASQSSSATASGSAGDTGGAAEATS